MMVQENGVFAVREDEEKQNILLMEWEMAGILTLSSFKQLH